MAKKSSSGNKEVIEKIIKDMAESCKKHGVPMFSGLEKKVRSELEKQAEAIRKLRERMSSKGKNKKMGKLRAELEARKKK